jgi:hypothetical protein
MPARPRLRTIPPPRPTILAATDLGSVEVAKHGNLYLLTDPAATSGWTVVASGCTSSTLASCRRRCFDSTVRR